MWWKNILVFVKEYFGLWNNKTITNGYLVKLTQDFTKRKHKTIILCTINVALNGDVDSQ